MLGNEPNEGGAMNTMSSRLSLSVSIAGFFALAANLSAAELKLPNTLVTTAYDTSSAGYSQMVAIGSMLKNQHGVNLRVLPGKNDVSRLTPLKKGTSQFAATGAESVFAQEAIYTFGTQAWGPMPIRLLLVNRSDACGNFVVAGDIGVKSMADMKGKRVAWVRGSPFLQTVTEGLLAFANLSMDDVKKVEVGGWQASIDGIVNGDIDATIVTTNSPGVLKVQASPRGATHPPLPLADEAGWKRLRDFLPWAIKGTCTDGQAIPGGKQEGSLAIYPMMVATETTSADIAYGLTMAMVKGFDAYKDSAPGADGWALSRQLEDFYLPWHDGAIRALKELGKWNDKMQAHQDKMLERQAVLASAWRKYTAKPASDFDRGWMAARASALKTAGMSPLFEIW